MGGTGSGGKASFEVVGGGWYGYEQVFTKGLDRLSGRVCDDAVARETVMRALPDSSSAEQGARTSGYGADFTFMCHISTNGGSILSGEAKVQDASERTWAGFYGSHAGKTVVRTSADGVEALAQLGDNHSTASVYVPCVPGGEKADAASESYALITEARVIGDTRSTGTPLRQAVTDFAYQLTKHAYESGRCQTPRAFPPELPHYKAR